jgi:hypothetical protein
VKGGRKDPFAMITSTPPRFQWRAFTSVLLTLAFLMLAASGTVLFLAPPGRVANWTNWTTLGLRKSDWSGLHIWFSATFLTMTAIHLVLNWRPLLGYFRNRVSRRLATRREWTIATAFCIVIFAGTRAAVPPFSWLLTWSEQLKESWDQSAARAPIPHAELLTLRALAENAGLDARTAIARLQAAGFTAPNPDATVQTIAAAQKISAQELYAVVRAQQHGSGAATVGKAGSIGWKTLRQFCADENLDYELARGRLFAKGITADDDATLRDIAAKHSQKPYDLVTLIRTGR